MAAALVSKQLVGGKRSPVSPGGLGLPNIPPAAGIDLFSPITERLDKWSMNP
jgi:hypothetical protein